MCLPDVHLRRFVCGRCCVLTMTILMLVRMCAAFARAGIVPRDALGGALNQKVGRHERVHSRGTGLVAQEDLSSLFCSEMVSEAFMRMGLLLSVAEVPAYMHWACGRVR